MSLALRASGRTQLRFRASHHVASPFPCNAARATSVLWITNVIRPSASPIAGTAAIEMRAYPKPTDQAVATMTSSAMRYCICLPLAQKNLQPHWQRVSGAPIAGDRSSGSGSARGRVRRRRHRNRIRHGSAHVAVTIVSVMRRA
jgi:hypothetical protein